MMEQLFSHWFALETTVQQWVFFLAALVQVILLVFSVRKRAPIAWVILYILEAAALAVAAAGSSHYDGGFWSSGAGFTHLFAAGGFLVNGIITVIAHTFCLASAKKAPR